MYEDCNQGWSVRVLCVSHVSLDNTSRKYKLKSSIAQVTRIQRQLIGWQNVSFNTNGSQLGFEPGTFLTPVSHVTACVKLTDSWGEKPQVLGVGHLLPDMVGANKGLSMPTAELGVPAYGHTQQVAGGPAVCIVAHRNGRLSDKKPT